jgi:hypothetical protein
MEELLKTIEYLKKDNEYLDKNRLLFMGYDRLIANNEKHILWLENRVEVLQDERYQEERRQIVEEMR